MGKVERYCRIYYRHRSLKRLIFLSTISHEKGSPMGSPLNPILADLVFQGMEETVPIILQPKLTLYFSWVDITLLLANTLLIGNRYIEFNKFHINIL